MLAKGCGGSVQDPDWPRFRGPEGAGINDRHPLPERADPEFNLIWKTPLRPGNSSPVVADNRIFVTGFESDRVLITALDLRDGRVRWEHSLPRERKLAVHPPNTPASPSPTTNGRLLVCFFQDFGLIAFDLAGRELWRHPLGPFQNIYGLASSPVLKGEKIILQVDQTSHSFLAAFSASGGQELWRVEREAGNGYSTPLIVRDGEREIVLLAESFRLAAHEASTGKLLWRSEGLPWMMKSLPVRTGERIFASGWGSTETQLGAPQPVPEFAAALASWDRNKDGALSLEELQEQRPRDWFPGLDRDRNGLLDASEWDFYRKMLSGQGGLLAFLQGEGPTGAPTLSWRYSRSVPEIASPLAYRGLLYLINDGGILLILDQESGEVLKRRRLPEAVDSYFASPVAGDGKIFLVSQQGSVTVLEAGPEARVLSSSQLREPVYATPALVGGVLLIRTEKALYAFGVRGEG